MNWGSLCAALDFGKGKTSTIYSHLGGAWYNFLLNPKVPDSLMSMEKACGEFKIWKCVLYWLELASEWFFQMVSASRIWSSPPTWQVSESPKYNPKIDMHCFPWWYNIFMGLFSCQVSKLKILCNIIRGCKQFLAWHVACGVYLFNGMKFRWSPMGFGRNHQHGDGMWWIVRLIWL